MTCGWLTSDWLTGDWCAWLTHDWLTGDQPICDRITSDWLTGAWLTGGQCPVGFLIQMAATMTGPALGSKAMWGGAHIFGSSVRQI